MSYGHRTCRSRSLMALRRLHKPSVFYICLSMFFLQTVWHTISMNFHHYGAFSLFFFSPSFRTKIASWFFRWVFNTFIFACVDFLYPPTSFPWNHQKPIVFLNFSQTSFVSRAPICQKPIALFNFLQTSLVPFEMFMFIRRSRCAVTLLLELPVNGETKQPSWGQVGFSIAHHSLFTDQAAKLRPSGFFRCAPLIVHPTPSFS